MSKVPCTRSKGLLIFMSSVTETSTPALGKQGDENIFVAPNWHFAFHSRCSEQRIRVREAFASLTRLGGCGSRSFGNFGQELFDVLVSVVALTNFHQAGKMEFHPGFDFVRRNVIT